MKLPPFLKEGDTIAVVSPAGAVEPYLFDTAEKVLGELGFRTRIMQHAKQKFGIYSGTIEDRWNDLRGAILDPEVKAIICGRGGYGTVHLLPLLETLDMEANAKWIVGFSDISVLHAFWSSQNLASVHAPMLRGLEKAPREDTLLLLDILKGKFPKYEFPSHPLNRCGEAKGILVGGNFSVLSSLIGTPYDVFKPGRIVFLEDVNEPIYKLERMLWQMKLSGSLESLGGLILGQFYGAESNPNYADAYHMIRDMIEPYSYPVAFGFPIGHSGRNIPLLIGHEFKFAVDEYKVSCSYIK